MRKIKAVKAVEFETKVIYKGEVFLRLADVSKVFGYKSQKAFISEYSDKVIKIKGCGNCIKQSDYNKMLEEDEKAYKRQEIKEVTKVSDARIDYNSSKSILPLKMMFGLQVLAQRNNMSVDEYIEKVELPKNREDAVSNTLRAKNDYDKYNKEVEEIKDRFSGLEEYGLELRFVTKECENSIGFRAYVVGNGFMRDVTYFDEYYEYDKLHINEANGDVILPCYNYDNDIRWEVNLSQTKIDRDFRQYGMIENLLYIAQEEIAYNSVYDGSDYVLSYDEDTLSVSIETDFITAMLKPEDSRYVYYDGTAEIEILDDIVCS